MFNKKTLLTLATSLLSVGVLASCGGGGGGSKKADTLYVCVYDGGYGTSWIETLANKYEEATGTHVEWKADSEILNRIENQLAKKSDYDIYMSHDINWEQFAARGYLENLDDLYESDVKVGSSTKKFKDRVIGEALKVSKAEGKDGSSHYYKVCYTQGAGGFIYNIDMFRENGWSVPTTYDELKTLCQTIVDAKVDAGDRTFVKPFAWSGNDRQYYWDYPLFEWWAQLAGMEKVDQVKKYLGPTGKYADGYEMYNPSTYYKEFIQAYKMWFDLVAENTAYSNTGAQGAILATAQSLFNSGKAAMIPYAQWGKYELMQANGGKALDFNIGMMQTPKATASAEHVNYNVGFGDTILIPNNASNESKALAKDFLRFMAEPESCKTFVEKSDGAFLAFDYNDVTLGDLAKDTYIQSVYNKITLAKNFNMVSDNPICFANTNKVMPWIENYYYYASAMGTDKANCTPEKVGAEMYKKAKDNWGTWLSNAGLKD